MTVLDDSWSLEFWLYICHWELVRRLGWYCIVIEFCVSIYDGCIGLQVDTNDITSIFKLY